MAGSVVCGAVGVVGNDEGESTGVEKVAVCSVAVVVVENVVWWRNNRAVTVEVAEVREESVVVGVSIAGVANIAVAVVAAVGSDVVGVAVVVGNVRKKQGQEGDGGSRVVVVSEEEGDDEREEVDGNDEVLVGSVDVAERREERVHVGAERAVPAMVVVAVAAAAVA